jgi:hypothetical protein
MDDDFGIAVSIKLMAAAFEFAAQFGKVVDLAVEYDPDGLVSMMLRRRMPRPAGPWA